MITRRKNPWAKPTILDKMESSLSREEIDILVKRRKRIPLKRAEPPPRGLNGYHECRLIGLVSERKGVMVFRVEVFSKTSKPKEIKISALDLDLLEARIFLYQNKKVR